MNVSIEWYKDTCALSFYLINCVCVRVLLVANVVDEAKQFKCRLCYIVAQISINLSALKIIFKNSIPLNFDGEIDKNEYY